MDHIVAKLLKRKGREDLMSFLVDELSSSELNTLLLEVFRRHSAKVDAARLLRAFTTNKFVQSSPHDPIELLETNLSILKLLRSRDFELVNLSPVTPLGTSSAFGRTNQDKVLTALRGCEVVSDATNVLALYYAAHWKADNGQGTTHMATIHQHLRTQNFSEAGFTPHFSVLAMASAGRDTGNYQFEKNALAHHVQTYRQLLLDVFDQDCRIRIECEGHQITKSVGALFSEEYGECIDTEFESKYYEHFRFKMIVTVGGSDFPVIDGGMVTWTQQLLQNRKERFLISGLGLDFLRAIMTMNS